MAIDYPGILMLQENGRRFVYSDRDTMLYALAVGLGADPLNEDELPFVYEKALRAVPTLATVVAWGAGVSTDRLGVNYRMVLHGEEEVIFHRPMPVAATLVTDSGIAEVYDKGKDKGATILRRTVLRDEADGEPIATINRMIFARDDGGCGGAATGAPVPHATPDRVPDLTLEFATRPDQAILYRLCGDRNPLHVDPSVARSAGFKAPILHGLCSYGITCRAVLQGYCGYDPSRIFSHAVRCAAPVYPGETLTIDLWRDGDIVSFEASVAARGVKVLKNGKTVLCGTR
jgi:acyl dehydratase